MQLSFVVERILVMELQPEQSEMVSVTLLDSVKKSTVVLNLDRSIIVFVDNFKELSTNATILNSEKPATEVSEKKLQEPPASVVIPEALRKNLSSHEQVVGYFKMVSILV